MLVKGEIDPAIITGTIRYAGYNQTLLQSTIKEAGRVYAKMTTRLDPYTGQARPDLPKVDARRTSTQPPKATMKWKASARSIRPIRVSGGLSADIDRFKCNYPERSIVAF